MDDVIPVYYRFPSVPQNHVSFGQPRHRLVSEKDSDFLRKSLLNVPQQPYRPSLIDGPPSDAGRPKQDETDDRERNAEHTEEGINPLLLNKGCQILHGHGLRIAW